MIIKKNYKENIKIKDLAYLNELGAEIVEFYPKNDQLIGKLYVTGNYHSAKTDLDKLISQDIQFVIIFENNSFLIQDIDCTSFTYSLIEGQGVEVDYEITVEFICEEQNDDYGEVDNENEIINESDEVLVKEERIKENDNNEIEMLTDDNKMLNNEKKLIPNVIEENELIKDEISKIIDQKLLSKLETTNENLPQNQEIIRNIDEKESVIKVIYYQNDRELNNIASSNHCSLEQLLRTNKQNNFSVYKRVIIKNE